MAFDTRISEWARTVGISRQSAHDAIKRCEIPVSHGKVDPLIATTLYRARTRIRSNPRLPDAGSPAADCPDAASHQPVAPPPAPAVPSAADHDLRRKKAEADEAEIDALRKAGRLMEVEPAERAVFEAFRELRDAAFAAACNAAPHVLGLTEVREVQHLLEDAMRAAYDEFETRMRHRLAEVAKP